MKVEVRSYTQNWMGKSNKKDYKPGTKIGDFSLLVLSGRYPMEGTYVYL